MIKHLPNTITMGNAFSGCIAAVFALNGNPDGLLVCILFCFILDFLDGFVARMLGIQSEIGKELDSLADMISFGFVPGAIVFNLLSNTLNQGDVALPVYLAYFGFLITVFSALRLAKFNLDTNQSDQFIGIPTPANTIFLQQSLFFRALNQIITYYRLLVNILYY